MKNDAQAPKTSAITDIIFETFRFHGRLIAFGDEMVKEFGLTSARWQVLGSIVHADTAVTVSHIARNLGLSRQAVQRVTNDLVREKFMIYGANRHHKRAKLVLLTAKGKRVYEQADQKYKRWAKVTSKGFQLTELQSVRQGLQALDGFCASSLQEAVQEREQ